jgi:hypothetical protein
MTERLTCVAIERSRQVGRLTGLGTAIAGLVTTLLMTGCAAPQARTEQADTEVYCFRTPGMPDKIRHRTCTSGAIPLPGAERDAKRFEPTEGVGTIYVVRRGRADTSGTIDLTVNAVATAETIPHSFLRIRVAPGEHQLAFQWRGTRYTQPIKLNAGDVRFVLLERSGGTIGSEYEWVLPDPTYGRDKAATSKLVADVDMRRSANPAPTR